MATRTRTGKHHAYFPPGHVDTSLWARTMRLIARHSRGVRAFVFEMPHNRVRTHLVARYFRDILNDLQRGDISRHLRTIDPAAEIRWFGLEIYRGPEGATRAIREWHATFNQPIFEMRDFVNPPGDRVLAVGEVMGQGAGSGASVSTQLFCLVTVNDGMATHLEATNDRPKAFEALGLSAPD